MGEGSEKHDLCLFPVLKIRKNGSEGLDKDVIKQYMDVPLERNNAQLHFTSDSITVNLIQHRAHCISRTSLYNRGQKIYIVAFDFP